MAHVTAAPRRRQEPSNASPARKDHRPKRKSRKNARAVRPRPEARYTLPGLIQEVQTPQGLRLDLAFCSLPLLVMGDR